MQSTPNTKKTWCVCERVGHKASNNRNTLFSGSVLTEQNVSVPTFACSDTQTHAGLK